MRIAFSAGGRGIRRAAREARGDAGMLSVPAAARRTPVLFWTGAHDLLPARRPGLPAVPGAGDSSHSGAESAPPARILIVEDDFILQSELRRSLIEEGFKVVGAAATADDAVRLAREKRPDIVIMDIRLRGKRDGVDAAIELFQQHGIRTIFATAHADPETRKRAERPCRSAGCRSPTRWLRWSRPCARRWRQKATGTSRLLRRLKGPVASRGQICCGA